VRGGPTRRTILGSALLAVLIGAAFAVLVRTIREDRDSAELATRSVQVIAAARNLERVVLDLETGQRGFLISRQERFLTPWRNALARSGPVSRSLVSAAAGVDGSHGAARELVAAVDTYIQDYSIPLVD
jgi:CHASE3 domain sensor protein